MLETVYARIEKRGDHLHAAVARGVPTLRATSAAQQKPRKNA
jgi:hypothetical protein